MGSTLIPALSSFLGLFAYFVLASVIPNQEKLAPIKQILSLPPWLQPLSWLKLFVTTNCFVPPIYAPERPNQVVSDVSIHINFS